MIDATEHVELCRSSRAPWVLDSHLQATNSTIPFLHVGRKDIKKMVDLADGNLDRIRIPPRTLGLMGPKLISFYLFCQSSPGGQDCRGLS